MGLSGRSRRARSGCPHPEIATSGNLPHSHASRGIWRWRRGEEGWQSEHDPVARV